MRVLILQGPNLNLLGTREPELYGTASLADVQRSLDECAARLGVELEHHQSNHEGVLVDHIQGASGKGFAGILINAAAFTHTSVALRDALCAVAMPFVEVHMSNVYGRESFRHKSLLADRAVGVVVGFGIDSYRLGLEGLVAWLREQHERQESKERDESGTDPQPA